MYMKLYWISSKLKILNIFNPLYIKYICTIIPKITQVKALKEKFLLMISNIINTIDTIPITGIRVNKEAIINFIVLFISLAPKV